MASKFDFDSLVAVCLRTHEEIQHQAARSINLSLVVRNWLFGRYMVDYEQNGTDRAEYGTQFIESLSARLRQAGIKGGSRTRLQLYRSFYLNYKQICPTVSGELGSGASLLPPLEIRPTVSGEFAMLPYRGGRLPEGMLSSLANAFALSWSHYVTLLTIDDPDERRFYEIEAAANHWSVRELERQIASSLYERLALSRDKDEIRRLAQEGQVVETAADLIKNPLVLEFLGLEEKPSYSETELESAIIDRLEQFLLELGKGFLFESRQRRFTFDNDHFYVDLVFYNRLLRCYVLIDLKRDKLTHQDLGQMQMYVNYFDRHVKLPDELPTVGIVLCRRKNDALVELTLPKDANIYAAKYQLYLPSKQELKLELEKIQRELGDGEAGS
jgi:predicted nuclease of restriction endonuclease-like (RecB) superfamily